MALNSPSFSPLVSRLTSFKEVVDGGGIKEFEAFVAVGDEAIVEDNGFESMDGVIVLFIMPLAVVVVVVVVAIVVETVPVPVALSAAESSAELVSSSLSLIVSNEPLE